MMIKPPGIKEMKKLEETREGRMKDAVVISRCMGYGQPEEEEEEDEKVEDEEEEAMVRMLLMMMAE